MKQRNTLRIWVFLAVLLAGGSAPAILRAAQHDQPGRAEDIAREAIEQLMRALELMIDSIPQYELPEIQENGDIIIRRKRNPPRSEPDQPGAPEFDETRI